MVVNLEDIYIQIYEVKYMNITFCFDGLQIGGIERVGIEYIKQLNCKNYNITIVNLNPHLNEMEDEIPKNIKIVHIPFYRGLTPIRYSKLLRMKYFSILYYLLAIPLCFVKKIYKYVYQKKVPKSDIAIAFSGHYNDLTFICDNYKSIKKVAWIHGDEASYNDISPGYFKLYNRIKNLVCLSENNDYKCKEFNKKNNINKVLIYNPINMNDKVIDEKKVNYLMEKYGDYILMVGRLSKDKDQRTLIKAIHLLNHKYSLEKNLILVGDGDQLNFLKLLVNELKLDNQVHFVGTQCDVQNYYSAATLYAHSSPAEGLPTVLIEAMYYGLPIAATDSKPGVREILREECGLITPVGDAEQLADSIYKLYTNTKLANSLVANSKHRLEFFLPDKIINRFEEYIKSIV